MTVVEAYVGGKKIEVADNKPILSPKLVSLLIEGIAQNTTGNVFMPEDGKDYEVTGSPTEKAILLWGLNMGMNFDTVRSCSSIVHAFPFNSEKERGGVAVKLPGSEVHIHWKGAAEIVLACCSNFMDENDQVLLMDKEKLLHFRKAIDDMDARSLRCVALAYREYQIDEIPDDEELGHWQLPEGELILLAIAGIKETSNLAPLDRCQVGGSCAVYAILSCIQEFLRRDNDDTVPSLQDPIGCCRSNGNIEEGWDVKDLLDYVLKYGLPTEDEYPFTGDVDRCFVHKPRPNQGTIRRRIRIGSHVVRKVDKRTGVQDLIELISTRGAVVVTIFIGPEFGGELCPPHLDGDDLFVHVKNAANEDLNIFGHAIMLIDHKEIKGRGYWVAKNWYGPGWGDRGYIRIDDKFTYMFDRLAYPIGVWVSAAGAEAKLDEVESAPNSPDAWLEELSSMGDYFG